MPRYDDLLTKLTRQIAIQYEKILPVYQRFFREYVAQLSKNYQKQFLSTLRRMPPPDEFTKEWVVDFISQPSQRDGKPLANDTVSQYLARLEVVAGWLVKQGIIEEDPAEDIMRPSKKKLSREEVVEEDEAAHIMRNAPNEMTRCYLHIIAELGPRADEALSIQIQDIKIDESNTPVMDALQSRKRVSGRMWRAEMTRSKTFKRPLYLYHSTPSVLSWLLSHPVKTGPLFVTLTRVRVKGKLTHVPISYEQMLAYVHQSYVNAGYRDNKETRKLKQMLKWLEGVEGPVAKGYTKKKWLTQLKNQQLTLEQVEEALAEQMRKPPVPTRPIHAFRHMVGTRYAKDNMNYSKMNAAMGWTEGSTTHMRYTHLVESDIKEEMYRRAGLMEEERKPLDMEAWTCPVCGNLNPATSSICLLCPPKPNPEEDSLRDEMQELKKELLLIKARMEKED